MDKYFFGLTDTGKSRENNEDSFIAEALTGDKLILGTVIDGVGGYQGGEVASAIARREILQEFSTPPTDPIPQMIRAFKSSNEVIVAKKQAEKELSEMACVATTVLADIENNLFYYAHVGDTRLYLLRDGSLIKISKDHSFVGFLEDSGRLDESAAMQHPKRNEINKAMGLSDQIESDESYIETGQSPFLPGDLLLLCSDGLTDMVNKNDITTLLLQSDTLEKKAGNLVALANENGGRDNITVVLLQNNKKPQKVEPTRPVIQQQEAQSVKAENIENANFPQEPANKPERKGNYGLISLIILSLILLGSTIFLYLQRQENQDHTSAITPATPKKARNSQEKLLQDALDNATGDTLILSDSIFKSPVLISDTLRLRKDSLYIIARGLVLEADSGYHGAALAMFAPSKRLTLDSLQFKGFDTAIADANQSIFLKNVNFIDCIIPVKNTFIFPNQELISVELPKINPIKNQALKTTDPKNGAN